jgi:N-acetylmuramoyl-L-alanine amidase
LKLGQYISDEFPEIQVIYTRDTDEFLSLYQRTEVANNNNADLFISIHCDGFKSPSAYGASVFVMGMSKLKANLDVAMRENAAIYMEDNYKQKYDGFDPKSPESYIVFSLMQNTYLDQSLLLAQEVESQFSNRANRKSRGVKQAPFYVISRTNMPSILIECGFLTNPKEEDYLHSELGQDYIASAIFRAFKSYKENLENVSLFIDNDSVNISDTSLYNKLNDTVKIIDSPIKMNLMYKVQIGTFLKSMMNDKIFIDIEAQEIILDGIYKYYVGNEFEKHNAEKIKRKMIDLGFNGSFIVPFLNGERISIKEALDLQMKTQTNE